MLLPHESSAPPGRTVFHSKITCLMPLNQCAALAFHSVFRAMYPLDAVPPPPTPTPAPAPVWMRIPVPSRSHSTTR